ncbi:MAG: hypothetical protein H6675_03660 [Dehalococcoidia bacterium]|nr:hypothetical protein [Dehalococcoidia bacterium]
MVHRAPVRDGALSRRIRLLPALLSLVLLLGACAASDPPPTSPLDESSNTATAPGGTTLPTLTSTPSSATVSPSGTPATNAAAEAERITGEAISRLAEWLGVPETDLRLTSIEAVDWPNACLGVENPALACAEVITPGYRVTLHHVALPETPFFVHTSKSGQYAWAPTHGPEQRTIESIDPAAGTVSLAPVDADESMGRMHRIVPGSFLEAPLDQLQAGQQVAIGTADPVDGTDAGLIVLLVPIAG